MTEYINNKLVILECILLNEECYEYAEVSWQSGFIYILLSKANYKYQSLSERILGVFDVLKFYCEDILNEFPVIVECLDSQELSGLFRSYGK